MRILSFILLLVLSHALAAEVLPNADTVRIKDLGRIDGVRDNMLVGYGLVTGLAGTGDSSRSGPTIQSISNMLVKFGIQVSPDQINARNVAAVMVTATLPPFARPGDKLDITISSVGDARSLLGGVLLMTPLQGPDQITHAIAQGSVSIGGFRYDLNGNIVQKNHPTSGTISSGALVELGVASRVVKQDGTVDVLLFDPDFTTSDRMAEKLNAALGARLAKAIDAGRVEVKVPDAERDNIVEFLTRVENVEINPDQPARVIVNERTGIVVAGGDVRISMVTITHGNLRVAITTDYLVSQPSMLIDPSRSVRTEVVPSTRLDVKENGEGSVSLPAGTSVADLVGALNRIKTSTRDIISILQAIKRAGALHAELVVE